MEGGKELSMDNYMTKVISLMSNLHPSHTKEKKLLSIKIELITIVFDVGHKQCSISGREG